MVEPGELFEGRYKIERELGRGSFSIVYLARDQDEGEEVAIKVLQPWTQSDEALRHRLRREAQLTAELTGAHSVRVHRLDKTSDDTQYMVMEYLDGEELVDILRRENRLPLERVEQIARQTLTALDESHRLGFVHRDLKPENLFICRDAQGHDFVKLFDFGIAKITGKGIRETTKLTLDGRVIGTPVYMSPEQCRGDALSEASDVYSLGVLLYEALAGRVPFDHENPVQLLVMHNGAPVPPLPPEIAPTRLGRCVMRALEKAPEDRFRSAGEFLRALDGNSPIEVKQGAPVAAAMGAALETPRAVPNQVGAEPTAVDLVVSPEQSGPGVDGRRLGSGVAGRWRWVVAVALVSLAAAVVVWVLTSNAG